MEGTWEDGGWWNDELSSYLGKRNSGNYFKGTLYKFKIYQKALEEQEVMEAYQKDVSIYSKKSSKREEKT